MTSLTEIPTELSTVGPLCHSGYRVLVVLVTTPAVSNPWPILKAFGYQLLDEFNRIAWYS
eukprot:1363024-Rhodomonas_salina.1